MSVLFLPSEPPLPPDPVTSALRPLLLAITVHLPHLQPHSLRGAAHVLAPLTGALKGPGESLSWSPMLV